MSSSVKSNPDRNSIDPTVQETFLPFDTLGHLVSRQCLASPRHIGFLSRRFRNAENADLRLCDELARQILALAGDDLPAFIEGYDFICDIQVEEEIFFRRHNTYRLKTVREAIAEVYSNRAYMRSYMHGLLMSQVFWSNHASCMRFYIEEFLPRNRERYDFLEIGPGHGLLFNRAASDSRAGSITGWDLSPASVEESNDALRRLGVSRNFRLEARNLFDATAEDDRFDAIVFSEVLEHLEEPVQALQKLRALLRPGGRVYINVPVNSPAPDHLFLIRSPEEVLALVESQGFRIERTGFFPATNYSLAAARKHNLTISVCVVAVTPGD
jgi:2-polyprenyl-3-methyl-5-hydroxy-6-metoxy-1,4-benzoquinol methylase